MEFIHVYVELYVDIFNFFFFTVRCLIVSYSIAFFT